MPNPRSPRPHAGLIVFSWLLFAPVAHAVFPPITEAEKTLTRVPGEPGAAAVVLFHTGNFRLQDISATQEESRLVVQKRIKILTEGGLEHAEISLPHSSFRRLVRLEGRTVLPDGRIIPIERDEKFQRRVSRLHRFYVTVAAFPAVEVGAILDLELELRFDNILYVEPWLFQDRIPTLRSEIVYDIPERMGFNVWARESQPGMLKVKDEKSAVGNRVIARADNAFPIPDEPYGFPIDDLSTRLAIFPVTISGGNTFMPLLDEWSSACSLLDRHYKTVLSGNREVERRAKEIAAQAGGQPRAVAIALYRLVRDEVVVDNTISSLWSASDSITVDSILAAGEGWPTGKALLLYALLDAAKLDPELVWAAQRDDGRPDLDTPNLGWFDRVLVQIELGRETVFLDPSDRRLGFGQLEPAYDGSKALLFSPKKPKVITLPAIPAEASLRRAKLDLELDAEGRLRGTGTLTYGEHAAFSAIEQQDAAEDPDIYWQGWLEESFGGFAASEVEVEPKLDEHRLEVRFKLEQHEEDVLGDETSLQLARPFARKQPFTLPPEKRQTPVLLPFSRREEVEVELSWPEGWEIAANPPPVTHSGPAGSLEARVEVDAAARRLRATRRFDLAQREHSGAEAYRALRDLSLAAEKNDAQTLALVRR